MNEHPISATKADEIRARFERVAAQTRTDADAFEACGDTVNADRLRRLAESQERMAAKRYESMRVVGQA